MKWGNVCKRMTREVSCGRWEVDKPAEKKRQSNTGRREREKERLFSSVPSALRQTLFPRVFLSSRDFWLDNPASRHIYHPESPKMHVHSRSRTSGIHTPHTRAHTHQHQQIHTPPPLRPCPKPRGVKSNTCHCAYTSRQLVGQGGKGWEVVTVPN